MVIIFNMDVSESIILKEIKDKNCNDSLKMLISLHSGICFNLILKYKKYIQSKNCDIQDLIDQKDYFIYEAAKQYKKEKNIKFSSWLGNYVKYQCLNCKRSKIDSRTLSNGNSDVELERMSHSRFFENQERKNKITIINEALSSIKDERIKNIYELRYGDNKKMTFKNISKSLGLSEPTIKKLHQKGKKLLSIKIKKEVDSLPTP
jgi:RNA polymerase sigma factor (sigma-70 family)